MKRILLSLIVLLFAISLLGAVDASAIYFASDSEIERMASMRGIDIGTIDEMRSALYEYEGLDAYTIEDNDEESSYNLSILSAESLEKIDSAIIISGNASISLSTGGSGEKILNAGKIIVDTENKQITALENVSFNDSSENASINEISADIISVLWESEEFFITDATTSSERKNSEDESVTFYTSGSKLTYFPDGGILYENGFISSDPINRYSSINADQIAMLPGGDMFISNAFLSIGRVPILYLPFFFFPGSRILGNPAFGFDSSKGAFVNTTFELLGSSPSVEESSNSSSFTAILRSTDEGEEQVPSGFFYKEASELSNAQKWAKDSESYIAIEADAYSGKKPSDRLGSGLLHLGLDSNINLLDKKLKLSIQNGIGVSDPVEERKGDSIFRFYGVNSISYSDFGLKIEGLFPYYSDKYVLYDFKNRLSGFSLDPILGQDSEFPENYASSLNSFTRALNVSYSLPSKYTNDFISSFSISNLRTRGVYEWEDFRESKDFSGRYNLVEFEKPYITTSISGSIFDLEHVSVEEIVEDEETPVSEIHLLSDPLLAPLYKESSTTEASNSADKYTTSLKYTISETLKNIDEYSGGNLSSSLFSSSTSAKFTLSAGIGSWLSFSNILTPSYTYSKDEEYTNRYDRVKESEDFSMNNEVSVSIPMLGLRYTLGTKLVDDENSVTTTYYDDGSTLKDNSDSKPFVPKWDKDTVTNHQISFSKAFQTSAGTFTPAISYTLKPLIGAVQPKLSYSFGPFSTAFSWKFLEESENDYKSDLIELSIGYNGVYTVFSTAMKYQSKDYSANDFFAPFSMTASASLRTENKKWSITEYIDYSSLKDGNRNFFNSIKTTFSSPFASLALNWKSHGEKIEFNDIALKIKYTSDPFQFWKGRIYLQFGIDSSFTMDMFNLDAATFTITPSLTFSIAEFLDFKFSVSSYNNNFSSYFDDKTFNFGKMFADLARSFDFFGDGRTNTNFLMRSASLEVVHYMKDWDLHCKYSTEFVQSGNVYSLVPRFSIFLSWKTLPDLKVDKKWEKGNSGWIER